MLRPESVNQLLLMLAVGAGYSVTCQVMSQELAWNCVCIVGLLSDPATVLEDEGTEYIRQAARLQYHHCMWVLNLQRP